MSCIYRGFIVNARYKDPIHRTSNNDPFFLLSMSTNISKELSLRMTNVYRCVNLITAAFNNRDTNSQYSAIHLSLADDGGTPCACCTKRGKKRDFVSTLLNFQYLLLPLLVHRVHVLKNEMDLDISGQSKKWKYRIKYEIQRK